MAGKQLEELMLKEETRREIVSHMRGKTNLLVRKTADLLGIKRGGVQYVKPKS